MAEAMIVRRLEDADDGDLIKAVRDGNVEAYGELYYRHCTTAMNVARRWATSQTNAEDLVAESFTAVLTAIRNGSGPRDNFPTYLASAVRNLSARWAERGRRVSTVEDLEVAVEDVERTPGAEETVLDLAERELVAGAFRQLSERDRMALWLVDVEGRSYAEAAGQMSLSTQALGTLLSRAREDLRDQFVAAHIEVKVSEIAEDAEASRHDGRPGSQSLEHPSALRLSRYARGKLPPRYRTTTERHLALCPKCRLLVSEAREVGSTVRGLAAPMLLAPFVLDAPLGAPVPPIPVFPQPPEGSSTGGSWNAVGQARRGWLGSKALYLSVGMVVTVVAIVGLLRVLPGGADTAFTPNAVPVDRAAQAAEEEAVAAEPSPLEIVWDDTDMRAGRTTVPFTVVAHAAVEGTASVAFTVPEGVRFVQRSPVCDIDGRTMTCQGVGPFAAGQRVRGVLVVEVGSAGPVPEASAVVDDSWPQDGLDMTVEMVPIPADGEAAIDPGGATVRVADVSVPMFGQAVASADGRQIVYTPNDGYRGVDGFVFTVTDDVGQSARSSVGVVVR